MRLLALILAAVLLTQAAEAQTPSRSKKSAGVRLSIRKADADDGRSVERLSYSVPAGARVEEKLIIQNVGTERAVLKLYTHDLRGGRDGSVDGPTSETEPEAMGRWLRAEPDGMVLEPGRLQVATITMEVPPDAAPGDHFGFFFVEFVPGGDATKVTATDGRSSAALTVVTRLGIPISERVPGEVRSGVELVPPQKHYGDEDLTVEFGVSNTGNVLTYVDGSWTLLGPDGLEVAREPQQEWGAVLPGGQVSRFLGVRTDTPLPRGEYLLSVDVTWGTREERHAERQEFKLALP